MGSFKDLLIKHIESCDKCIALEDLREKLNDFVKLKEEDVFTAIDDLQIECCQNADL